MVPCNSRSEREFADLANTAVMQAFQGTAQAIAPAHALAFLANGTCHATCAGCLGDASAEAGAHDAPDRCVACDSGAALAIVYPADELAAAYDASVGLFAGAGTCNGTVVDDVRVRVAASLSFLGLDAAAFNADPARVAAFVAELADAVAVVFDAAAVTDVVATTTVDRHRLQVDDSAVDFAATFHKVVVADDVAAEADAIAAAFRVQLTAAINDTRVAEDLADAVGAESLNVTASLAAAAAATATDASPTLAPTTRAEFAYSFANASELNAAVAAWVANATTAEADYGPVGNWDTSRVTELSFILDDDARFFPSEFNEDIGAWDTSRVTNMLGAFFAASTFDADIGDWDVSKVQEMDSTFSETDAFNADIGAWDVSQVKSMQGMFYKATVFNQNISGWDVSSVTAIDLMFDEAEAFDSDNAPHFPS